MTLQENIEKMLKEGRTTEFIAKHLAISEARVKRVRDRLRKRSGEPHGP